LFLADTQGGKKSFQVIISAGVTSTQPKLRMHVIDQRGDEFKDNKLQITAARTKTTNGYKLEALLPWSSLGLKPAEGMTAAAQLYVNDSNSDSGNAQLRWFPVKAAYGRDTIKLQPIVLAEKSGAAVEVAAFAVHQRFRNIRFEVAAIAALTGKTVTILNGAEVIGRSKLSASGRLAQITIIVPVPAKPVNSFTVAIDGKPVAAVALPDIQAARKAEFEQQEIIFRPAVFTGKRFPAANFEQPSLVEDLIGQYTIKTTFYDSAYNAVTAPDKTGRYGAVVDVLNADGQRLTRQYLTLYRAPKDVNWRLLELPASLELPQEFGINAHVAKEQQHQLSELIKYQLKDAFTRHADGAILLAGLSEMQPGTPAVERTGPRSLNEKWWHGLKKKIGDAKPLRYVAYVSPSAGKDKTKRWPTILFLHGSGDRGDDLTKVERTGPLKYLKSLPANQEFPFIVIAPQCPEKQRWQVLQLQELLDEVMDKYPVDPDRLYLTGLSLGGFGSWMLACEMPNRFAAVVPICGGGEPADAQRIKDVPVWVFHGDADRTVPFELSSRMVDALRKQHGRVKFTIYPGIGHNSWTQAYNNPDLYRWMLEQARNKPTQQPSTMTDKMSSEPQN